MLPLEARAAAGLRNQLVSVRLLGTAVDRAQGEVVLIASL
jgi:hypothetical protein